MPGRSWNEASLSESPAVEQLEALGYTYVEPETLDAERESLKEVVLAKRLASAIARLNPWLSDDNVQKAELDAFQREFEALRKHARPRREAPPRARSRRKR